MRSKNAAKNLIFSLFYEVFVLLIGIITPRYVILYYGSTINGLTSLIGRLLGLVSLIQAGAVGSAIFQMYKPVASGDYETQSSIIYSAKRFYNRIGVFYLLLVTVISIPYGFFLQDESLTVIDIILSFIILAGNSSFYLFFTSIYDIVFSAYQKKYIILIGASIEKLIYYLLLVLVIGLRLPFIFMYLALSVGCTFGLIFNSKQYKKFTSGKIENKPQDRTYRIPNRKYLMGISIIREIIITSPIIIITSFKGLSYASVFSIYQMIYTSIRILINSTEMAVSAIFGNLVASTTSDKINTVEKLLELVFFMMGTFLASCTAYLIIPFVRLYTNGIHDINYLYPTLAAFIVCYIIVFTIKTSIGYIATVSGLFKDLFRINLVLGGICLLVLLGSALLLDFQYLMIPILLFELFTAIITIRAIRKNVNWFTYGKIFQRSIILIVLPTLFFITGKLTVIPINSWIIWIIWAMAIALISLICIGIYCLIFERVELLLLKEYIIIFIKQKKRD